MGNTKEEELRNSKLRSKFTNPYFAERISPEATFWLADTRNFIEKFKDNGYCPSSRFRRMNIITRNCNVKRGVICTTNGSVFKLNGED